VTQPQVSVDASTNRISTAGFQYDAAGNLTNDTLHTYTYDGENRVKTIDGASSGYVYDGAGLRVKTSSTLYIFAGAKVIAEYPVGSTTPETPDREYVYSGGQLLATFAGTAVKYSYPDHLSTRVEADSTGAVLRKTGHLPFGDAWYETLTNGGVTSKWKFTSYERDSASDTDYAIFRNNSWRYGRFMQADKLAGSIGDPQSLNRFAYTRNDPVNLVDPIGLFTACWAIVHYGDDGRPEYIVDVLYCFETGGGGGSGGSGASGIVNHAKKLLQLLALDPKCLEFLNKKAGPGLDSVSILSSIEKFPSLVGEADMGAPTITETGPTYQSGTVTFGETGTTITVRNAQTDYRAGELFTVNTQGAYFLSTYKGHSINYRGFQGGSSGAQAYIVLHELAHKTKALIPDKDDQTKIDKNDRDLEKNCEKTIKALKEGK
jgi:RHS repeat-associated protein